MSRAASGEAGTVTGSHAPLVMVARFRSRPGRTAELRRRLGEMVRLTSVEPGCMRYELHEDREDPDHLVLLEEWSDRAALDRHMETDHVRRLVGDAPDLVAGDIRMLHLRPL